MITAVTIFSPSSNIPIFGAFAPHEDEPRPQQLADREQQRDQTLRALQSEIAQNYQQMLGYGKEFVQASKKRGLRLAVAGKYDRGHGFGARPSDRRQQPVAGPL